MNLTSLISSIYNNDGDARIRLTINGSEPARFDLRRSDAHAGTTEAGNPAIAADSRLLDETYLSLSYDDHRRTPLIHPRRPAQRTKHGVNTEKAQASTWPLKAGKPYESFHPQHLRNAYQHSPERINSGLVQVGVNHDRTPAGHPDDPAAFMQVVIGITSHPAAVYNDLAQNNIRFDTTPGAAYHPPNNQDQQNP
jgi:hypothetical protein